MQTGSVGVDLEVRGKTITTFIVDRVHQAMEQMAVGDRCTLVTDPYPAIETDVRSWARVRGHRVLTFTAGADSYEFEIEKGERREPARSIGIVISSEAMLDLLSPLGFALGAALEGHEVSVYFQGPGVRVLDAGFRPRLTGWGRPFSRIARRGIEASGHVTPHEKLRALRRLGGRIYACGPSMDRFGVDPSSLVFSDVTIAEYLTFVDVMVTSDAQIYS